MKTLLDTNFIIEAVKNKIPLFEELDNTMIPTQVLDEIKLLVEKAPKRSDKEAASLALTVIKSAKFQKIDLKSKDADTGIIKYLEQNPGIALATNDRELKSRIKKKGVNVKFLRIKAKKKIEMV